MKSIKKTTVPDNVCATSLNQIVSNPLPHGVGYLNIAFAAFAAAMVLPCVASAREMGSGETNLGNITEAGAVDEYTFEAERGNSVTIAVATTSGNLSPRFGLYSPDGTLLKTNSVTAHAIDFESLPGDGTYQILVRDATGDNLGLYNVSLAKLPGPQGTASGGGPIAAGQTKTASLLPSALAVHTMDVSVGDRVTLTVQRTSGAYEPQLDLYDPSGRIVFSASGAPTVEADLLYTKKAGTYYAVVRSRDGGSGIYNLGLEIEPGEAPSPPSGARLFSGHPQAGELNGDEEHVFTFFASARDAVSVSMGRTDGTLRPRIDLYDPNGNLLDSAVASTASQLSATIKISPLTQAGFYSVLARDSTGSRSGAYELTMAKLPGAQNFVNGGGRIQSGATVSGVIEAGEIHVFAVNARVGESISAGLGRIGGTLRPRLELYAPNGRLLRESGATTSSILGVAIDLVAAPITGTYFVIARANDNINTGSYSFTLVKNPGPQNFNTGGKRVVSGQMEFGSIGPGKIDVFTFGLSAGDSASMTLGRTDGDFRPRMDLFGPDGSLLKSAATSVSSTLGVAIDLEDAPETGTYTAVVRDVESRRSGTYSFTLAKLPGPQVSFTGGGSFNAEGSRTGTLAPGKLDVFTFGASMGNSFSVTLQRDSGNFFPRINLYAPDGFLVASNATTTSSATSITVNVDQAPQAGTYYIVCRDRDGARDGSYTLTLSGSVTSPTPGDPPVVSSIEPSPVIGAAEPQPVTIRGSGFHDRGTVHLYNSNTGEVFPALPVVDRSGTFITVEAPLPRREASWAIEVVNPSGQTSGEQVIMVAPGDGFEQWAQQIANVEANGPDGTPMGDRITNIMKYAAGWDPNGVGNREYLLLSQDDEGRLELFFERDSIGWDLVYELEASHDLETWQVIARAKGEEFFDRFGERTLDLIETLVADSSLRPVTVIDNEPHLGGPIRRFLRLRVWLR